MNLNSKIRNFLHRLAYSIPITEPHKCSYDGDTKRPFEADRPIDRLIGQNIFKFPGIGYYGPSKPKGGHLDQTLCATQEEAFELYKTHWKGSYGTVCWREIEVGLSYWKDGWGTLTLPDFSRDLYWAKAVADRVVAAGPVSFSVWTVPSISSVSFGWTATFKESVYPPSYSDLKTQIPAKASGRVWTHRADDIAEAICVAALKAHQDLDDSNFVRAAELLPNPYA